MNKSKLLKELKLKILPSIIRLLIYLVGKSVRFTVVGEDNYTAVKGPVLFTFWHNRIFLSVYYYRYILGKEKICVLASPSRDGDILARVIDRLGFSSVRGSSRHYGKNALKTMLESFKGGFDGAIVPDGPQGPKYEVKEGVVRIARRTGLPIVPTAYNTSVKKILSTWDSFILPAPFSRAVLIYGKPLVVSKKMKDSEAQRILQEELEKITRKVDRYFDK